MIASTVGENKIENGDKSGLRDSFRALSSLPPMQEAQCEAPGLSFAIIMWRQGTYK